jgi:outer membrane receptor protein involved in Fe transport
MSTNNAVQHAVRCVLLAQGAGAAMLGCTLLFAAMSARAQTPTPAAPRESTSAAQPPSLQSDNIGEIFVVGSRIRHDTFNSPSPVQVVTREETTLAGFNSTAEALQNTAVTAGAAQINNAFGGFVTDGGPGANTLSLRGLGASRTLVLINGRRVAPAGTRGAVGSADLNVLPNAMIERVEILRDGASSIYGSDAVAGVVNVITQNNVHGLTFETQYNRPTEGGGEQARFSMVGGLAGERWDFAGSLEYYERSDLTLADRDWTRCNTDKLTDRETGQSLDFIDPMTGRPKCYPVTGTGSNGVTINTIGTQNVSPANFAALGLNGPAVGAPGSSGPVFSRFRPNSAIGTGVIGFEGVGGGNNNLNVRDTFEPDMLNRSLISPVRVYTAFLQGSYNLQTLGNADIYFEFLGNRRRSEQTGYRQLTLDYRRGSPLIPSTLAFSDFAPDQGTSGGERVGVRTFIGFGNERSEQTVDFYKPTIGLRGELAFLSGWRYDLNANYSKSDAEYRQQSFLTDKVILAGDVVAAPADIDPSLVRNGLTCRVNLTNPAERCIPYPPLNSATIGGDLPPDFVNYIFRGVVGNTTYDETVVSAIFDGPLFALPAGEVQVVFGLEYRRAEIDDAPDANSIAGNLYQQTSAAPTHGSDNVSEAYMELEVPVLRELPFANELTFNGSFRFTDYESYGSDTTHKLGLIYSPVSWLAVRASKGTSFRAPALFEQFQGSTSGFLSQAGDPCNNYGSQQSTNPPRFANCSAELPGQPTFQQTNGIRVLSEGGAFAGLEAETSQNITYGLILQPSLGGLGDLSIAVDYFDIEIENGVEQPGAVNVLPRCYDDPDFRAGGGFCRLVTRDPVTGALTVSNAYTNIATQVVRGIDYALRFARDLGPGNLRFSTQLTQYKSQATKLFPEDLVDQLNGTINTPDWSGTADIAYTLDKWRFSYGVSWVGSMQSYDFLEEDPATTIFDFDVGDYYEHFASIHYTNNDWQVTAGMRNILNEEPPTISQGFYNRVGNAPIYSGYDFVGREAFLTISKSF